jgi:Subtilase family
VVRLRGHLTADQLMTIARLLRRLGYGASLTHCVPLQNSPVGKGPPPPGGSGTGGPPGPPPPAAPAVAPAPAEQAAADQAPPTVVIAIIDTGITAERRGDGRLAGIVRTGENVDPLDGFPLPGGDGLLDVDAGHGTFVAGIVERVTLPVAGRVEIRMYRAIDSDGIGSEYDVAAAIVRAVEAGAQIVNLSCGCNSLDDEPPVGLAAALEIVGDRAVVVAAAGNYGTQTPVWPAAFPGVVGVAALTNDEPPIGPVGALWSSRGGWVDASTVGEGVRSTFVQGTWPDIETGAQVTFGPDAMARWLGTSFAAPQVSGAIARVAVEEGMDVHAALDELLRRGVPLPGFGQELRILPGLTLT